MDELAELARLEFHLTDVLYYGVVKGQDGKYRYHTVSSIHHDGEKIIPVFTTPHKALANLFLFGYSAGGAFIQMLKREDGVEFADTIAEGGNYGFFLDAPLNTNDNVVFFFPDKMREWAEAVDGD